VCPRCGAVYNSDLVAYCAHHFVALVDADEAPVISEPHKQSPALLWMIVVITLTGSLVVGSLITLFLFGSNRAAQQAATSPPTPQSVQKGTPTVGHELEGKVASLPLAQCPLNGQEAIPGTVVVRVVINKNGQVTSARASGGDWLLRGAASEAAMKSTFSPEKLHGRETEGTITYTFEP
jgi:TonB family protein